MKITMAEILVLLDAALFASREIGILNYKKQAYFNAYESVVKKIGEIPIGGVVAEEQPGEEVKS